MNISELLESLNKNIESLSGFEKVTGGLIVTALCMVIVFIVLVLLMYIIKAMKVMSSGGDKKDKIEEKTVLPLPQSNVVQSVSLADDSELVAVITAAVAMSANTDPGNLLVRSIVRTPDTATNWSKRVVSE